MVHKIIILIFSLQLSFAAFALDQDTTIFGAFKEVTLIASRIDNQILWSASRDTIYLNELYQNNLRSALDGRVGIQSLNGENFAQDLRISIRGYGSRSAFGVRGIRLYLDDIPLTAPDGTSQLDEVSIFDIASIETVRSGLSATMGNAGGGAISFGTANIQEISLPLELKARTNTFGAYDFGAKIIMKKQKISNLLNINHHRFNGKRTYSEARTTSIYNKTQYKFSDKLNLSLISGFYISPEGNDPGALTQIQVDENPWQANPRNVQFSAGESVSGYHVAAKSDFQMNTKSSIKSLVFYRKRIFEGKLPNENGGVINLNRDFLGTTNSLDWKVLKNTIILFGHTIEFQKDQRTLFRNNLGIQAEKQADQFESVFNNAFFQQLQWSKGRFSAHQLLRYDNNRYKLEDLFGQNGFQDGSRNFNAINGGLGVSYQFKSNLLVFANVSSSFEMPTLNELSNNPNGLSDFNASLNPENSLHYEIGAKSSQKSAIKWAISCFYINLQNQIQGYETANFPGKIFYRNANSSTRSGVESEISAKLFNQINIGINYTYSNFVFKEYIVNNMDFSNNFQPLIPRHKCNIRLDGEVSSFANVFFSAGYNSEMWLDDANLTSSKAFFDINMMLSSTEVLLKNTIIGIQANNLFNTLQYSNFRVNAIGNRYYEAASPMHLGFFVQYKI